MKKIFRFLFSMLIIYSVAAVGCFAYTYIDTNKANDGHFDYFLPARFLYDLFGGVPEKTNFVIFGTDEDGTRTDTVMAGCYDRSKNTVKLVSIPRDTIVTVDDATYKKMCKSYPEPDGNSMKLNSVYHFSLNDYGSDIAVEQVENLIGAKIDYYCVVNFKALACIVDSIGGVKFDVPCDMYYSDPEQDLYIDLSAGEQTLDGDTAEQLLRFRSGYDNADLGRIEVQQNFMKEFISQATSTKNISHNASKYIKTYKKYVKTNMPISRAIRYARAAKSIKSNDIKTITAPGYTDYVDGISGYVIDDKDGKLAEIFG